MAFTHRFSNNLSVHFQISDATPTIYSSKGYAIMKNIVSLVFAGIIGGLITLAGGLLFNPGTGFQTDQTTAYAQSASYKVNNSPATAPLPFDFTKAAEKAMPVVVHISAAESTAANKGRQPKDRPSDPFRQFFGDDFFFGNPFDMPDQLRRGSGSGVIISEDGYVVTNNHVVEFADEVEVTLFDNRAYVATVIGTDPQTDLAVLKIEGHDLPTLQYADSDAAKIGEWVLAVGNPFDLNSTVTAGIISAKGRNINIISGNRSIEAFIQTDAAVNPGNSGGALVDAQGRLLGINTAIATQTGTFSGYSFAIPVKMMEKIVADIIEYGSYQRAFLGINISDMDSERAEELNLSLTQGVYVESLVDGGAAQLAGVLPKDVIISVDNREVKSVPELQELIGRSKVGNTIILTVVRRGKEKRIPVALEAG